MRLSELRQKEVINCRDGKCIGHIWDIDFDVCTGKICSVIIPGPFRICGICGKEFDIVVPFKCIKCIGVDVVIVDIDIKECKKN